MTGYGVRSGMLVGATQHKWLVGINVTGALAAGVIVIHAIVSTRQETRGGRWCLRSAHRRQWVNHRSDSSGVESRYRDASTLDRMLELDQWPTRVTLSSIARSPRKVTWVTAATKAKELRLACETYPKGLEPIRSLEAMMREVRMYWIEARGEQSMLEPVLGEALEQLALAYSCLVEACGCDNSGLTTTLEETLLDGDISAVMRRRRKAQVSSQMGDYPRKSVCLS